ncbi:MAG: hypothetical protein SAL70_09570 [Scytonema sp. PMC 1070.18]|nr:hypothetical protein [Scytonema sp. PMC 1070.18]
METFDFDNLTGGGSLPFNNNVNSFNSGNSENSTTDSNNLFASSPWGRLSEVGINSFEDVFGNVGGSSDNSPFGAGGPSMGSDSPYGSNPFAGDNFWNTFAGGVNPTDASFGANNNFAGGAM